MAAETLLFIDTNIWLDFYRARNDAAVKLLRTIEKVSDRLIVTYQLESEFKRNRQMVLRESWENLKPPVDLGFPNIVGDAKAVRVLTRNMREAKQRVERVKRLIVRAMESPSRHDPVYQACERIFRKSDALILTRQDFHRRTIRNKALRRFLQGYPPRKRNDTSMGDGFNWEWMVYCAAERKANLVIITRDGDFGVRINRKCYPNDHLAQEFKERVSQRRKVIIFDRLTDGLKYLDIPVTKRQIEAEDEWTEQSETQDSDVGVQHESGVHQDSRRDKLKGTKPRLLPAGTIEPLLEE
jgi:predicted nucleic acid-binding protein